MTILTPEGVRRIFAARGCERIAWLHGELSKFPRDAIAIPFTVAFVVPGQSGKSIYIRNLLDLPLDVEKGNRKPARVESEEHLALLLRSVPHENLIALDAVLKAANKKAEDFLRDPESS